MAAIAYSARSGRARLAPVSRGSHLRVSARVARRRRQVAVVVALLLVASAVWALGGLLGWLGSGPLAAPGPDPSRAIPVSAQTYVVQPGDTLWSIARSLQPNGEIRPLVDRLAAQEHGGTLRAGDVLTLP